MNDRYVQQLLARIGDRATVRADSVFQNVQWLNDVSARTFLGIMNGGYSRALGVTCDHCHDTRDFASDAKRQKNTAREMAVMLRAINGQLRQMKNVRPESSRSINCTTCHRGMVIPGSAPFPRK